RSREPRGRFAAAVRQFPVALCHTAKGQKGAFGTRHTTARQLRELASCPGFRGKLGVLHYANRVMARCGTAVRRIPDMLELTLRRARNHKGVGIAPTINSFTVRPSGVPCRDS